jgi:hypothetical protein
VPPQHLVFQGSPRPIHDYVKFIDGPAWYPGERVEVGSWITIHGRRARWVFVPPRTNESIFSGHVVLVWTAGGHTYGVGFHDWNPRSVTRAMDIEVARHLRMVVG